ncbi:MAG TPA: AAA family ATPase [Pyrinomonadaceae bacterium]|nr:AAA family ATPase [Pyrinomonadaceae bacterium]
MLKRIKIHNYKSLMNVDFKPEPLAVIFGPNAAGKSNFLDSLQLLSRVATSRTLKDAFEPPYRGTPLESFAFDQNGIKGLLAKESASFSIEVDVELSEAVIKAVNNQIREMKSTKISSDSSEKNDGDVSKLSFVRERYLRYRIEIEILPKSGFLRVTDEYLAALNKQGEPTGKRKPFLERIKNRLRLRMEGQAHPTDYERHLDYSILSMAHYAPHHPHLVAMQRELARWFIFYFEPRERMRASTPVKEVNHIGLMGEELAAFLNTLRAHDEPQFRAVEKSLHRIIPSITGIDVEVNNLGEVELRLIEDGTPIPARVLSEGTLRILGLLALDGAKERPSLLGFEEPENGIHPRRISLIAELLKTRAGIGDTQVIVTTHSPILPDLIPDKYLYVCRKSKGQTTIDSYKATWGSLGREEDLDHAMNAEEGPMISERMLRGDFDA